MVRSSLADIANIPIPGVETERQSVCVCVLGMFIVNKQPWVFHAPEYLYTYIVAECSCNWNGPTLTETHLRLPLLFCFLIYVLVSRAHFLSISLSRKPSWGTLSPHLTLFTSLRCTNKPSTFASRSPSSHNHCCHCVSGPFQRHIHPIAYFAFPFQIFDLIRFERETKRCGWEWARTSECEREEEWPPFATTAIYLAVRQYYRTKRTYKIEEAKREDEKKNH